MNGCIYRTKDGECELWSEGGKYHAFCDPDCHDCIDKRPSNADKIRAMSDEELADYFGELTCFPGASREICRGVSNCYWCWLKWLEQEAQE